METATARDLDRTNRLTVEVLETWVIHVGGDAITLQTPLHRIPESAEIRVRADRKNKRPVFIGQKGLTAGVENHGDGYPIFPGEEFKFCVARGADNIFVRARKGRQRLFICIV